MNKAEWRGAALVAAVYFYFLIFAEFAFLELALPVVGEGDATRRVMGMLGLGGVLGSVMAARRFRSAAGSRGLAGYLLGCAAGAGVAMLAAGAGAPALAAAGLAVGYSLGGATVTLAAGLRERVGMARLGRVCGLGTGLAYAGCNLPVVFTASPQVQSGLAVLGAVLGAWLAWPASRAPEFADGARREAPAAPGGEVVAWVLVFLALVWMDSAAFYVIQHTEGLKAATWSGAWALWGNALVHLAAAWVSGLWLDRGRAGLVSVLAGGALALACGGLTRSGAGFAYVAGVSLYSAALVYVAARVGRARATAWIFAVSGWVGSALGIGMAQDLHGVPGWFGAAALALLAGGLGWRARVARAVPRGLVAILGLGALGVVGTVEETRAAEPVATGATGEAEAAILRGREVYVAEGCIHCHSQYVRPGTSDVERWGPARELAEILREKPPLPGNRRQGPDLLNVGNRRDREWNRLHLIDPWAVTPGSRMPSYAGLFAPGETRGEDLLAYLESRGADTADERAAQVAAWKPEAGALRRVDAATGARWFSRLCVRCHGAGGAGDGELAGEFSPRAADLTRAGMDRDEERLARLIKFGRPGTAMAGHEVLDDATVLSLARHVAGLQGGGTAR